MRDISVAHRALEKTQVLISLWADDMLLYLKDDSKNTHDWSQWLRCMELHKALWCCDLLWPRYELHDTAVHQRCKKIGETKEIVSFLPQSCWVSVLSVFLSWSCSDEVSDVGFLCLVGAALGLVYAWRTLPWILQRRPGCFGSVSLLVLGAGGKCLR